MIDKGLVIDRLSRIRENLRNLKELGALAKDDFLKDTRNFHSAARQLQIAIEACLDVGHHIISRKALRRPKDYKDIFLILGQERIIPLDFAESLVKMAKYRNRLVHLYWEVSAEEIFDTLQGPADDLDSYIKYVAAYVDKEPSSE